MAFPGAVDAVNSMWSGGSTWSSGQSAAKNSTMMKGINEVTHHETPLATYTPVNTGYVSQVSNPVSTAAPVASSSSSTLPFVGGLLSTGAQILGGIMGYNAQKAQNEEAARQFNEMLAFQKDQYYNAVKNRVADANRSGIHPLAALGINPHGSASPTAHAQAATAMGEGVRGAGQTMQTVFQNLATMKQLELMDAQIIAQRAMAVRFSADAGEAMSRTDFIKKDLANYHLYRAWNSVNGSIGALGSLGKIGINVGSPRPVNHGTTVYTPQYLNQRVYM